MPESSIVLIGPLAAGKTTVGKLLGEALALPVLELDSLRWAYYAEIGYDPDKAQQLRREGGMKARAAYWKPFEIHSVERVLADYPTGHVLSFGAGHSVYADPTMLARAQAALAGFANVILLLPSADVDQSLRILRERFLVLVPDCSDDALDQVGELNRFFIEHPSNPLLAKWTVYTVGKSAGETCDEIIKQLR